LHDQRGLLIKFSQDYRPGDKLYVVDGILESSYYIIVTEENGNETLALPITFNKIQLSFLEGLSANRLKASNDLIGDVKQIYVATTTTVMQQFDAIFDIL
jgi:hypothetical protein